VGHPIIDKIVNEGVQAVNVSMLSSTLRGKLMSEAGSILMHQNRFAEAAHAFALAENKQELKEHGRWFLEQHKLGLAALFLLHVEDETFLQELAQKCLAVNEIEPAKQIYESLHDDIMLSFLRENFKE